MNGSTSDLVLRGQRQVHEEQPDAEDEDDWLPGLISSSERPDQA